MSELLFKKVNKPWQYEITLNGESIPFVSDVEIKKDKGELARIKITIIIADSSQDIVIIES